SHRMTDVETLDTLDVVAQIQGLLQRCQSGLLCSVRRYALCNRELGVLFRHAQPHPPLADRIGVELDLDSGLLKQQFLECGTLDWAIENNRTRHIAPDIVLL